MIHAVVRDGGIRLAEPLPADWPEGQPLQIDKYEEREPTADEIKRDFALLNDLCADNDRADEELLERALQEADRIAKDQVRREMGLS